jgi:hypothetical protein
MQTVQKTYRFGLIYGFLLSARVYVNFRAKEPSLNMEEGRKIYLDPCILNFVSRWVYWSPSKSGLLTWDNAYVLAI